MRIFLISLSLCLLSPRAWADLEVAKRYFEDKSASLTIEDILAKSGSLEWRPMKSTKLQFGPTKSRVWLRFFLPDPDKPGDGPDEVLLLEIPNAYLRKVAFYGVIDGKVTRESLTGMAVPLSLRDDGVLRAAAFTFRILPPRDPKTEYFLSAESDRPLTVPFHLWKAKNYTFHQWTGSLFLGVFFGSLVIAAGFNGFLAFSLRSRLYFNYAGFVACIAMAFFAHEGLSIQFLWPESPWWAIREPYFFGGLASIFYVCFVREFLDSPVLTPWLDRILLSLVTILASGTVLLMVTVLQPVALVCQVSVILTNLLVLVIACKALTSQSQAARYFILSSAVFNSAVVLFLLQETNLIWIGAFLDKAPHIGLALEVLLLSFALGDRIRQVNQELAEQKTAMVHSEKMSALGRLAGEIAHEINNPLAIIHGNATLIGKLEASPQIKEFAFVIGQTANRISKIVKGMRSLARDSRSDPLQRTALFPLLQDAAALCEERAQEEKARLELPAEEERLFVNCRSSEVCQVLLNLLNNSLDAVRGRPDPLIRIEAREKNAMAEIAVVDNGPGVPQELHHKILEPFFTTKRPGEGLGLGLSISRSIVEAHGGKLYLDESSALTRFTFTLPLAPDAHEPR